MLNLLLLLIPIALLDSLNPTAIGTIIVLLAMPKPVPRVIAAIAGFGFAYFVFGVLVVLGAGNLIAQVSGWFSTWFSNPPPVLYVLQLALAAGLFYYFFRQWRKQPNPAAAAAPSRSVRWAATPAAAFALGAALNASELPTAFPYLAALERVTASRVIAVEAVVALLIYAVIFVLPLILILALYLRLRERAAPAIERISGGVERWSGRLLAWGALLVGLAIVADSALFFLHGDGLF